MGHKTYKQTIKDICGADRLIDKAWDKEIEVVYSGLRGTYTASQYYRRFGNSKLARGNAVGTQFENRTHCGQLIRIDEHGLAYCPICHKIFNSGKTFDNDRPIVKTKFKEGTSGPPCGRLMPTRWATAGRATSAAP
jgi:hypothetical protein